MTTTTMSKKKLFAHLIVDDIIVEQYVLNKAWNGDGSSLYKIGRVYYKKKDYIRAIDWFRLGAAKDHADSQLKIGYIYHHGEGISVDYKLAMEWFLKAHNNGNIRAANSIGLLYELAKGVRMDCRLALKWYLKAANKANAYSQYNVGLYYEQGHGAKVDKQYALEWFEKSAEQGNEKAKDSIKRLNDQGYYIDDRQKRYLQLENDLEEQKLEIEALQSQLKESEQKRLQSDNENKLLKQEIKVFKLKNDMDTKNQANTKDASTHQLEGGMSKLLADWVSSNTTKSSTSDGNPENDICYDK